MIITALHVIIMIMLPTCVGLLDRLLEYNRVNRVLQSVCIVAVQNIVQQIVTIDHGITGLGPTTWYTQCIEE